MNKTLRLSLLAGVMILLNACRKEAPFTQIKLAEGTKTAEMGSDYAHQVYFDLSEGTAVVRPVNIWDLAFQSAGGTAVRTNFAKKTGVYVVATDFASTTEVPKTGILYDDISLDPAKTAIGNWQGKTYVINLGLQPPTSAVSLGFKKLKIEGFSNGKYSIRYANLDGTEEKTAEITVNPNTHFTYFSLLNHQVAEVEPEKGKWDIVATGITLPGGGPPGSYVVTVGFLSNRFDNVQVGVHNPAPGLAASDVPTDPINNVASTESKYEALTKADFPTLSPSADAGTIGRSWWQILQPHAQGNYKVYDWKTYMMQDAGGRVYKMKFLTFKGGPNVTAGYPSFRYNELP